MSPSFNGKVAFVTGAGTGIGAAVAEMLSARGAKVALFARRRELLEQVAERIRAAGGEALVCLGDVSKAQDLENAIAATVETFGALNLAVNNAGIIHESHPITELSVETWDKVIAVNLSGIFYGMKFQIPRMMAAGGGAIVNISSIFADRAFPTNAAYVTAKHGIRGLTRTAAREFVKNGVRINEVMPGLFATDMTAAEPEQSAALAAMVPLGRLGNVEEVAAAICFLLSDEASYITGTQLAVDAGFLA